MTKKVKGWPLPAVIDPPKVSICIEIPNDPTHIQNFLGNLISLGFQFNWQRDAAHTALSVSEVWYQVYLKVADDLAHGNYCNVNPVLHGSEVDLGSPLRIDCDCQAFIECCDGTEKQLVTVDMVAPSALIPKGTNQPKPGGGSAEYCLQVFANGSKLISTPVNTGDVIALTSVEDGTNDPNGPDPQLWFCGSGDQFFGGVCVNHSNLVGTDPLPTVKHMALILNINGSFYDITAGPVTVPAGVVNIQPTLQVNDSTLADNNGFLQACVTVTNNQANTFDHLFDFTRSDGGFFLYTQPGQPLLGNYVAGVGWKPQDGLSGGVDPIRRFYITRNFAGRTITRMRATYAYTKGTWTPPGPSTDALFMGTANGGNHTFADIDESLMVNGPAEIADVSATVAGQTALLMAIQTSGNTAGIYDGDCTLISLEVWGIGSDPF